ncbi:hypothetical protein ABPG75_005536 [Micractinium tetrahymenae]
MPQGRWCTCSLHAGHVGGGPTRRPAPFPVALPGHAGSPPGLPPHVLESLQPERRPTCMGLYSVIPGQEGGHADAPAGRYFTVASWPAFCLLYQGLDSSAGLSAAAELAGQVGVAVHEVEAVTADVELTAPPVGLGIPPALFLEASGIDGKQSLPCVGFAVIARHEHSKGRVAAAINMGVPPQLKGHGLGHLLFDRLATTMPKDMPLLPFEPVPASWGFWCDSATLREQLDCLVEQCGVELAEEVCCDTLGWEKGLFESLV